VTRRDLYSALIGGAVATAIIFGLDHAIARSSPRGGGTGTPEPAATLAPAAGPVAPDGDERAWRSANTNLAEEVKSAQERLARNEAEKRDLQNELESLTKRLAAAQGSGGPPPSAINKFDLTQSDWKELAATGAVKAIFPCGFGHEFHLSPGQANALGLAPGDVSAVELAIINEEKRLAGVIQGSCAAVLGSADLARRLGPKVCNTVVLDSVNDTGPDMQLVADVRAGNVAMPAADKLDPLATVLLAQTEAQQAIQSDLERDFGAEDAHRIAFAPETGLCSSAWGGRPTKR
jgi:hypothetical protein